MQISFPNPVSRGAFIVLEGVDRCGKTTQCSLLLKHLTSTLAMSATAMCFPDRTTAIGILIDGYLQSTQNLEDRAVHLLFSANRWEAVESLTTHIASGRTIVCDRYAHSGVAFSSAKDANHPLTVEWCKSPDQGLPAPDAIIFLTLSQDEAETRGGYGGERYEKRDLQLRVRNRFEELKEADTGSTINWHIVDAAQSMEDVQRDINIAVLKTINQVKAGKPLGKLWVEGVYDLSTISPSV